MQDEKSAEKSGGWGGLAKKFPFLPFPVCFHDH